MSVGMDFEDVQPTMAKYEFESGLIVQMNLLISMGMILTQTWVVQPKSGANTDSC